MKKALSVVLVITLAACAEGGGIKKPSDRPFENWEKGAVLGAAAGAAVGSYMDSQKRDLEKNLAQEIQSGQAKVEKLPNDVVRITMTSATAFDTNSTDIKPGFYTTLDKL